MLVNVLNPLNHAFSPFFISKTLGSDPEECAFVAIFWNFPLHRQGPDVDEAFALKGLEQSMDWARKSSTLNWKTNEDRLETPTKTSKQTQVSKPNAANQAFCS